MFPACTHTGLFLPVSAGTAELNNMFHSGSTNSFVEVDLGGMFAGSRLGLRLFPLRRLAPTRMHVNKQRC